MAHSTTRFYIPTLIAIVLLAFALRVYQLDAQSLWYDEGVTAMVARTDLPSLTRWTANDIQPPLYYYVVAAWGRLAGWSEWSLRFASVFFGTLTVPLLAILATKLSRRRLVGLLAALITAVHPLLVYYSQEARMYAMLLALGVLTAYWVVGMKNWGAGRLAPGAGRRGGRMARAAYSFLVAPFSFQRAEHTPPNLSVLAYVLTATAAAYTHYFAFFLLLALALAYGFSSLRTAGVNRARAVVTPFFVANVAVLALYLPWIGVLFTQLDVDASYWEGSLKLWEAVRHIAISFTSGETVLEATAVQQLTTYGMITIIALMESLAGRLHPADGERSEERGVHLSDYSVFSLLWLAVPVAAVLALASFTPKFNARYAMLALPALILIWSDGLGRLLTVNRQETASEAQARNPRRKSLLGAGLSGVAKLRLLAGIVLLGALLVSFSGATRNWFTDPAFTKDQWRELVSTVRAERDPNESVVLVSGHAWPVWDYYAPDIQPIRLPEIDILDVNAVLDFPASGPVLRQALSGKEGVWLINWQDEVVDPMGVVPLQMELSGQEQPVDASFWGLKLRHFTGVRSETIPVEPPVATPVNANFGGQVQLLGYRLLQNGDLLLFWSKMGQDPLPDLHIKGETFTEDDVPYFELRDRRPAGYLYPAFRWQPGQATVGRIPAAEWAGEGAPAGTYHLRLKVYDPAGDLAGLDVLDAGGRPLGKQITLALSLQTSIPLSVDPSAWHEINQGLFADVRLTRAEAEPGQPVRLELRWYAERESRVRFLRVNWDERARAIQYTGERLPLNLALAEQQSVRTVHITRPPGDLPPGEYWLEIATDVMPAQPLLLPFTVKPSTRVFEPPPVALETNAVFGQEIRLVGLQNALPGELPARGELPLTLVWQAVASPQADYSVTVQLLDNAGRPVSQQDLPLPDGASNWMAGQVETQDVVLSVPDKPGTYRLIIAIYDATAVGLPRLPLQDGRDALDVGPAPVRAE